MLSMVVRRLGRVLPADVRREPDRSSLVHLEVDISCEPMSLGELVALIAFASDAEDGLEDLVAV